MKRSAIRVGVVYIEGTNCEEESAAFFRHLGAQAEKVHLKQLTGDVPADLRRDLDDYDILMIPGGFAAGDYVRAGTIFAARLRSRLSKELTAFVRSGINSRVPIRVRSCDLRMTIPMTAHTGGAIHATPWTSFVKPWDCSMPGRASPCARTRTENASQDRQTE